MRESTGDSDRPRGRGGSGVPFAAWLARKLLAAAYDLLYHSLAPAYDLVSWLVSGGRWGDWQRAALDYLPRGRILEVGPGTGRLLVELLESGRDTYAVERSPEMLRIATERLRASGREGRIFAGDARRLPFDKAAFDGLVLTFPAPFLADFWPEAARVLRPGGKLVVVLGAESRQWPWPGALEWALSRLAGRSEWSPGQVVELAPGLTGQLVDRPVGVGVAHLIVAERGL